MPTFLPFSDYSEHAVINGIFAMSGLPPINRGTFVKVFSGYLTDQHLGFGAPVGAGYGNTVSNRFNVPATVTACTSSGDVAIGMTLYDYKETDEHGNKLVYDKRKAAEMEVILSGQAMPIVTNGLFLYSGIAGNPTAGTYAYLGTDGGLNVSGSVNPVSNPVCTKVGTFLGPKNSKGVALLWLNI